MEGQEQTRLRTTWKCGKIFGGEVFPCWISGFDQCDFFLVREVFQVFFACYGPPPSAKDDKVQKVVAKLTTAEVKANSRSSRFAEG